MTETFYFATSLAITILSVISIVMIMLSAHTLRSKQRNLVKGDDVSFKYDNRTFYGYFLSHKDCKSSYVADEHGKRYIVKTKKLRPL